MQEEEQLQQLQQQAMQDPQFQQMMGNPQFQQAIQDLEVRLPKNWLLCHKYLGLRMNIWLYMALRLETIQACPGATFLAASAQMPCLRHLQQATQDLEVR